MTNLEHNDPLSFWSGKAPDQIAVMRGLMQEQSAKEPFPFTDAIKLANSIRSSLKIHIPCSITGPAFHVLSLKVMRFSASKRNF